MPRTGDTLIVVALDPRDKDREAEILEVCGENCGPPYLVRWLDDGTTDLFFPRYDVYVKAR